MKMKGMWIVILLLFIVAIVIQSHDWINNGQIMAASVGKVLVSWQPNKENDLKGYKIYFGNRPFTYNNEVNVGNSIENIIENLETNKFWYFTATAYDTAGNESIKSEEVSIFLSEEDTNLVKINFDYYNFPNPFNPNMDHTVIRFYLAEFTLVSITVYDHTEHIIKKLISKEMLSPGEHLEPWDGRYESGAIVANGVYYAVIELEGIRKVVQMVVVKGKK